MKTLLILGASSEIGVALIKQVSEKYDRIVAHYNHTKNELVELQKRLGNKLLLIQADFSDESDTVQFIDQIVLNDLIPEHIVHLPAIQCDLTNFHKIKWNTFAAGMNISLRSAVIILGRLLPIMAKAKVGKVVLMLTICTQNLPPKYLSDYVTVKYALMGLMRALAVEYADKGILINGISPDMIDTKFISNMPMLVIEQNAENNPAGNNLTVDSVIPVIEFLLSEGGNSVSGQNIGIAVGQRIRI